MVRYQSTIVIDAAAARIWAVLADVEHWHEWTPSVRRIERLDPPAFAVGGRFRIFQPGLLPAIWAITELSPERSFIWVSRRPGLAIVAEHLINPVDDGRCELSLRIVFKGALGHAVGWLGRKLAAKYLALESAGLKRRSEDGRDPGIGRP